MQIENELATGPEVEGVKLVKHFQELMRKENRMGVKVLDRLLRGSDYLARFKDSNGTVYCVDPTGNMYKITEVVVQRRLRKAKIVKEKETILPKDFFSAYEEEVLKKQLLGKEMKFINYLIQYEIDNQD